VWDSPFEVTEEGIFYSGYDQNDPFLRDIETIFDTKVHNWIIKGKSKEFNFSMLVSEVEKEDRQVILIMVDLYFLPHSNYFGKKHLPHLLLAEGRKEMEWELVDPYYRWNGLISDQMMRQSFGCEGAMMGVSLSLDRLQTPEWRNISVVFEKYRGDRTYFLAEELEKFIRKVASDSTGKR